MPLHPSPHSNFLHRTFLYSSIDMASQHNGCDPSNLFVKAMNDVRLGGLSIRKSAKKWEIKRTTLQDRLSGRVETNRRKGPPPILTKQEENQFADWLIVMANRGFGMSKESNTLNTFLDKDGRTTPFHMHMVYITHK